MPVLTRPLVKRSVATISASPARPARARAARRYAASGVSLVTTGALMMTAARRSPRSLPGEQPPVRALQIASVNTGWCARVPGCGRLPVADPDDGHQRGRDERRDAAEERIDLGVV